MVFQGRIRVLPPSQCLSVAVVVRPEVAVDVSLVVEVVEVVEVELGEDSECIG